MSFLLSALNFGRASFIFSSFSIIFSFSSPIAFNNFSHESVGGQPTAADVMDIPEIAKASGYQACYSATTEAEVKQWLEVLQNTAGPSLLEIQVDISSRSDLGRPTKTPQENKEALMSFLKQS